jgi:hypothetical protein
MAEELDIKKIDKNMDFQNQSSDGMDWYTVDDEHFVLTGLAWRKKGEPFRRMPFDVHVSTGVDNLAWHTAGVMVRFCTDATEIRINTRIDSKKNARMDHMASVGSMGYDLYVGSGSDKIYTQSARFNHALDEYNVTMFGPNVTKKMREITIHFPLYSHPEFLEIGLNNGATLADPSNWVDNRPIVVYGTSIAQGGCASRPGMAHTNIMSRMLNRPFINLGFSGNGKGEKEMAQTIATIENPAMFVLDYDANALVKGLKATLSDFIDILREKHPNVPILLVSRTPYARDYGELNEFDGDRYLYSTIHLEEVGKRRAAGDENIHYLDGSTLFGNSPTECTVDGVHPTDLGFFFMAQRTAPVISRILAHCQDKE